MACRTCERRLLISRRLLQKAKEGEPFKDGYVEALREFETLERGFDIGTDGGIIEVLTDAAAVTDLPGAENQKEVERLFDKYQSTWPIIRQRVAEQARAVLKEARNDA